jgi:hypothetical protein
LFNPNERDELDNLEEIFSESGIKKYKKGDPNQKKNLLQTLQFTKSKRDRGY